MVKIKKRTLKISAIIGIVLILLAMSLYIIVNNYKYTSEITNAVMLETNYGEIVIELYLEEMPITAGNFKNLTEQNFYDGVIFHRIIEGFMIQGGDPTGTGGGGPGYLIPDEFTNTELDQNNRGTISMANAGPNTGGSQFFINLVDNNYLDGAHPVFGRVAYGMDIVDEIGQVSTDLQDRPLEEVIILRAYML